MKRLTAIILVLSLFLLLPACAAANQPVTDLKALEKEVADAWAKKGNYDEVEFTIFNYYGTDNGYHIVFFRPVGADLQGMYTGKIAEYKFVIGTGSQLLAYRNGRFIKLSIAYHLGLVSEEAVAKAAELHNQATTSQEPEPTEPLTPKEAYIRQYGPVDIFREYTTVYEYGNAISIIYAVQQDAPASETVRTIAGFEFKFQREGSLCVYKHGVFTDLEEAYNKKLIAKEHIERVAKTHARSESKAE